MTYDMAAKVAELKQWARDNYDNGHADFMAECWLYEDYENEIRLHNGDLQAVIDMHRRVIEAGKESAACYEVEDARRAGI